MSMTDTSFGAQARGSSLLDLRDFASPLLVILKGSAIGSHLGSIQRIQGMRFCYFAIRKQDLSVIAVCAHANDTTTYKYFLDGLLQ